MDSKQSIVVLHQGTQEDLQISSVIDGASAKADRARWHRVKKVKVEKDLILGS